MDCKGVRTWYLGKIPKVAHFYWGNETISFLRYLTIYSFKKLNPDWKVKLYYPKVRYKGIRTWKTPEHAITFSGKNYFDKLSDIDIEPVKIDFSALGFNHNVPEPFKADFLRWQLLSSAGGLWSDFDIIYFRPMEYLYFNNGENSNVDTLLCIDEKRCDSYKHSIGFLMSSPGNELFKFIRQKSYSNLDLEKYQSIGSIILNTHFPALSAITKEFKTLKVHNLRSHTVYPMRDGDIEAIYNSSDMSLLRPDTIGLHWYGGYSLAGYWENVITERNFRLFDTVITKIIGEVI